MNTKWKGVSIIGYLSVLVMFVSFGEQRAEWIDEREFKNESGITHIIAANSEGNKPKIKLKFIGHLGEIDGEDDNYLFYKPSDITGDSEDNLYVLDGGNHRVQKFDNKGKYLLTFGRSGQGPGELQRPLSIDIDEDDNIYLTLLFQNRVEKFTSEGKLVFQTSRPVPKEMDHRGTNKPNVYTLISQGIDVDSQGRIWIITVTRRPKKEEIPPAGSELTETDRYRLDVFDSKGTFLKSFPLTHFCSDLRIIDDKIYILEQSRTMQFYIYKIN